LFSSRLSLFIFKSFTLDATSLGVSLFFVAVHLRRFVQVIYFLLIGSFWMILISFHFQTSITMLVKINYKKDNIPFSLISIFSKNKDHNLMINEALAIMKFSLNK